MKVLRILAILTICVLTFGGGFEGARADNAVQLAQSPSHVCFNDCMEENGSDAKGSCARKCGLAGGVEKGKRDCGTEYKVCNRACDKRNKDCKKRCREIRKNCY